MLNHHNWYGLLSEDVDPQSGKLWGNFPTCSMTGLILTAMRISRSWKERYRRGETICDLGRCVPERPNRIDGRA